MREQMHVDMCFEMGVVMCVGMHAHMCTEKPRRVEQPNSSGKIMS